MGLLDIVGGMLGGQGAAGGGGQDALLKLVMGLLSDNGQGGAGGGLGGLLQQLQQAGLGDQVNSWVGTGQNLPVSAEQLQGAFGADRMSQMAEQMGLSTGDLGAQLSQMLPQVVDKLTPNGQLPEGGLGAGGLGDLGGLLESLMRR